MTPIWISAAVMICVSLSSHLGLNDAIADTLGKILKCGTCSVFWTSLVILLYFKTDIFTALALSISASYLSNYLALLLNVLNNLYSGIWERLNGRRNLKLNRRKRNG